MSTIGVSLLGTLLALCAAWMPVQGAELTAWKPQRNVELVVGAQAGGANDRFGRQLQRILTEINAAPGGCMQC